MWTVGQTRVEITKINALVSMKKIKEVKENENAKRIDYVNETTRVIWWELDWVLYIEDLIQL